MPLRVVMISSEVESLARTGGLGDVVEALSLALAEIGHDVLVVTPLYGVTRLPKVTTRWPGIVPARWGWGPSDVRDLGVVELETVRFPSGGLRRVCLLDDAGLFQRPGIYADAWGPFSDNPQRFAVLSRGGLEVAARVWSGPPDVVHAHDWHASFAVVYAKLVMGEAWAKTSSVFTVHNLAFQGTLDESFLDKLHLPRHAYVPEILWHEGHVNLMKGATALADRITTVSPTYAKEILTPEGGFGLDLHLRAHAARLVGIVNGIDSARFDPRSDAAIAARYDESSFEEGRAENKVALSKEVGLEPSSGPLFGLVGRLTWQKGIDLVLPLVPDLVERGARFLLVGQGEPHVEDQLLDLADRHAGKVAVRIAFDPPLSRRVYAGADYFLVPSRFEPCGLTQMYAMRYGSIPIVTDVGGLHDTVDPIDRASAKGTGFVAPEATTPALKEACDAALAFPRPDKAAAIKRAMAKDFAWAGPARAYEALYVSAREG